MSRDDYDAPSFLREPSILLERKDSLLEHACLLLCTAPSTPRPEHVQEDDGMTLSNVLLEDVRGGVNAWLREVQCSRDEEEVGQSSDPVLVDLPTCSDKELERLEGSIWIHDGTDPSTSVIKEEGKDLAKAGEKRKRKSKGEYHVKIGMQGEETERKKKQRRGKVTDGKEGRNTKTPTDAKERWRDIAEDQHKALRDLCLCIEIPANVVVRVKGMQSHQNQMKAVLMYLHIAHIRGWLVDAVITAEGEKSAYGWRHFKVAREHRTDFVNGLFAMWNQANCKSLAADFGAGSGARMGNDKEKQFWDTMTTSGLKVFGIEPEKSGPGSWRKALCGDLAFVACSTQ